MKDHERVMTMVLDDTISNKLTWRIIRETSVYRAYATSLILTPKKKLEIVLNSFTTGNQLSNVQFYLINDGERNKIETIGFHFAARQIFDLFNILKEKYDRGDFKNQIMVTHTEVRDSKIVRRLLVDTMDDKIIWRVINVETEIGRILYSTSIDITKHKKLVFQVSSNMNMIRGNFLRVVLKNEFPNQRMQLIRKIDLIETPILNALLRILHDRHVGSTQGMKPIIYN